MSRDEVYCFFWLQSPCVLWIPIENYISSVMSMSSVDKPRTLILATVNQLIKQPN